MRSRFGKQPDHARLLGRGHGHSCRSRFWGRRCGARGRTLAYPDIEKAPLYIFEIAAGDHADISPVPSGELETPQRARLKPDEKGDQEANDHNYETASA